MERGLITPSHFQMMPSQLHDSGGWDTLPPCNDVGVADP